MKLDLISLQIADDALMKLVKDERAPHIIYIQQLDNLCRSCGWTLREYWEACLNIININWDTNDIVKSNSLSN